MIGARMTMMGGAKPYDAEVEYIESTGTQWIDTGVVATSGVEMRGVLITSEKSKSGYYFGVYDYNNGNGTLRYSLSYSNYGFYPLMGKDTTSRVMDYTTGRHDFIVNGSSITIDTQFKTFANLKFASSVPIYLFARAAKWSTESTTTPSEMSSVGFGNILIYDDGTLVRDFIPVRKGSVGYMYDRVSGKLFGNQGTGEFIVGADVEEQAPVSAKSYIQGGLVAMWDGIENAGWGTHDANATVWKSLIGNHTLVPYGVRNVAFNEEDFEIKNIDDTYAECDSSDLASLVVSGCTIELCMYRPGWVNPGLEADDYGVLCVADKVGTGNTTNRILCFDTRTGTTTRGVLQYRQAGWQSEASRINPILGLDFGKPIPIFIKCYGDKAVLGKSQGGDTHTSKSFENSYASAKLGLNTYWFGEMFSFATSAKYNFIRVYNRILTDEEIAHNYAVDKERFGL